MMEHTAIRKCSGVAEMQMCVELQREVWGFSDAELVPLRMFVVAEKIGGQVIGAFDGKELVGFAMAIPGVREVEPSPLKPKDGLNGAPLTSYLHSHMLAVREGYRDKGLGRGLKLFQREEALARGIELMEWTFDPGDQKRISESGEAWSYRKTIQCKSVRYYELAVAGWIADGSFGCGMVAEIEASRDDFEHGGASAGQS